MDTIIHWKRDKEGNVMAKTVKIEGSIKMLPKLKPIKKGKATDKSKKK